MGRQRNADLSVPSLVLSASLSFSQPGCLACVQSVPIWHPLCQQGWEKFTNSLALPLLYLPFFPLNAASPQLSHHDSDIISRQLLFFPRVLFLIKSFVLGFSLFVWSQLTLLLVVRQNLQESYNGAATAWWNSALLWREKTTATGFVWVVRAVEKYILDNWKYKSDIKEVLEF